MTVTVVDRSDTYRHQLCQVLTRCPGVVVFDQCATLQEAHTVLKMRMPRVVLLGDDLADSPGWDGLTAVRALGTKMLLMALSDQRAAGHIRSAFQRGAVGYLLRQTAGTLVQRSIHEVTAGGAPMSPEIARALVQSMAEPEPVSGPLASLSRREREVLELLSVGARYQEIAHRLELSRDTVHSHAKRIYRKLMVRSKTEASLLFKRGGFQAPVLAVA
ncbi:MAG: hypothetical protein RIR76_2709 [Verrucomicrobiota bacterium]